MNDPNESTIMFDGVTTAVDKGSERAQTNQAPKLITLICNTGKSNIAHIIAQLEAEGVKIALMNSQPINSIDEVWIDECKEIPLKSWNNLKSFDEAPSLRYYENRKSKGEKKRQRSQWNRSMKK